MSAGELADRRQRAREAAYDEPAWNLATTDEVNRIGAAIETATRVQITPEVLDALAHGMGFASLGNRGEPTLRAVFEAAGFEVEP